MTLEQLLRVIPDLQEISVHTKEHTLNGREESIGSMLREDIYNCTVIAVVAKDDVLKVRVMERADA